MTTKSPGQATGLENHNNIEQEKLKIKAGSIDAQVNADVRLAKGSDAVSGRTRPKPESARRIQGVLQVVPVQVGQRVPAGTNLARVAVPGRLKAELHIPKRRPRTSSSDSASVDT